MEMMAEVGVRLQLGMRLQLGVLRYAHKCHVQFNLIASLIAHVHGKECSLSKSYLLARATNHKTIILITNSIKICRIRYLCMGTISRGLLRCKIQMHMTF